MNITTTERSAILSQGGTGNLTTLASIVFSTPEALVLSAKHENDSYHDHTSHSQNVPSTGSLGFVLIPLIVVLAVALISGMAIYCIQRRQKLDTLRHSLIPMYTYAPGEDDDEWGVLLDNVNPPRTHQSTR